MRLLFLFAVALFAVFAQSPAARIINTSRPGSNDYQVGDRWEILVSGAANQPVSVRTMRQGRTDWGPVIGSTDSNGRWSVSGSFEKADFGGWSEVWTVGGKAVNPSVSFFVSGPCTKGGRASSFTSGPNEALNCETTDGERTFVTPSLGDPFRTPDGRTIEGRLPSTQTAEQYRMQIMESLVSTGNTEASKLNKEAGDLVMKMMGVNALTDAEIRNVLSIVRTAYEQTQFRAGEAQKPAMLMLLQHLEGETDEPALKREISETIDFVRIQ
jgi:hypothetical protein